MTLRVGTSVRPLRPAARWVNGPPSGEEGRRPLLVHFWSLSCEPCLAQLPRVERWARELGDGLRVVSVHSPLEVSDMDHEKVIEILRRFTFTHPVALDGDDGALADIWDISTLPAYFVFGADQVLRAYFAGEAAADEVERALLAAMGQEVPRRHSFDV